MFRVLRPQLVPPIRPGRAVVLPVPPQLPRRFSVPGLGGQVSGSVRPGINFQYSPSGWLSGQTFSVSPPANPQLSLSYGAGVGQILYASAFTLSFSGAPIVVDLQALVDPDNYAFSFSTVRYAYVQNNARSDGWLLLIGGAGPGEWDGPWSAGTVYRLGPSTPAGIGTAANSAGKLEIWEPSLTGLPVTSLSHLLKFDPGGRTFTADVLLAGA